MCLDSQSVQTNWHNTHSHLCPIYWDCSNKTTNTTAQFYLETQRPLCHDRLSLTGGRVLGLSSFRRIPHLSPTATLTSTPIQAEFRPSGVTSIKNCIQTSSSGARSKYLRKEFVQNIPHPKSHKKQKRWGCWKVPTLPPMPRSS